LGDPHPESKRFLTFSNSAEYRRYIQERLPSAGWSHRDHTAGSDFFVRDGLLLGIGRSAYAGTAVGELSLSLQPAPATTR
jgi:hypothetical protein